VLRAGLDLSAFPCHEIEIRGKHGMLAVRTVASAAELPDPRFAMLQASGSRVKGFP
jgi:hypothetical protein